MSDAADMFKKLAQNRQKSTPAKTKSKSETKPVSQSQPPKETKSKAKTETSTKKTTPKPASEEKPPETAIAEELTKKRGRPATGKRSDPDWIGRTYYIRKETDLDIEDELIKLKREGINVDKSELVDFLLAAWVKWRNGENIDFRMSEISPRRKDELP
ncbi:hypothetical protein [Myxosarcina sp. GI1]|uniref:hypothetical protein n=1 Tax=Myxosarcina sp. GI1 TaxID=1541065 RepID=UPI00068B49F3|nr:hypothetical protein [Myxosarcina sp. GI1]